MVRKHKAIGNSGKTAVPELKAVTQWLIWKMKDGRKVPLNKWGQSSGVDRPADFMTYDEAKDIYEKRNVDGVAFVFTETDGFFGIDLDNSVSKVTRKTKTFKPWAEEILNSASSYSEISPSLKGLKIFCKGKLPDACRHRFDIGDGQMEIYESGRFFTFTEMFIPEFGREINEFDPAELIKKHTPETPKPRFPETFIQIGSGSDLRQRGEAYIQNAERPLEGARNSTAFNLAGHLFSLTGDSGERLSEGDVFQLMKLWNLGLAEPLSETELGRCVKNSRDKGTPRETKPAGVMKTTQTDEFDFNVLWGEDLRKKEPPKPEDTKALEEYLRESEIKYGLDAELKLPNIEIGGLVGEIWQWITDTALYPQPAFNLLASLSLVSVLVGKRIIDATGNTTNLYCCIVGPSGCGKDHPQQSISMILESIGEGSRLGATSWGSHAGMVSAIREQNPILFPVDEIGTVLSVLNQQRAPAHIRQQGKFMLELYSSAKRSRWIPTAYADNSKSEPIEYPHMSIFGSTTPETLFNGFTKSNCLDGLLARFLFADGDYIPNSNKDHSPHIVPTRIRDKAMELVSYTPIGGGDLSEFGPPQVVGFEDDAKARIEQHRDTINLKRVDDTHQVAAVWSRSNERAVRIAMIIAAGKIQDGHIQVNLEDVENGIALSDYSCRWILSKAGLIELTEWAKLQDEVLEFIGAECLLAEKQGGLARVTRTKITRKFRKPKKEMDVILEDLIDNHRIERIKEGKLTWYGTV